MILAPTHEEEITALVAGDVLSERGLPVRLFQIGASEWALKHCLGPGSLQLPHSANDILCSCLAGRKFRDEARPRAGLLRGREFVMKDLYTFDSTAENAKVTYNQVKDAYCRIFDRLGLPYMVVGLRMPSLGELGIYCILIVGAYRPRPILVISEARTRTSSITLPKVSSLPGRSSGQMRKSSKQEC